MCNCVWCGEFIEDAVQFIDGEPIHHHCVEEMNTDDATDTGYKQFMEFEDDYGDEDDAECEDDGQPSEYEEWQDYMGGDDWDFGQFDSGDEY